jgi:hypothetical protein
MPNVRGFLPCPTVSRVDSGLARILLCTRQGDIMSKRTAFFLVFFSMLFASTGASADVDRRGAMLQCGLGMAVPIHDAGIEEFFSYMESSRGIDRMKIGLGIQSPILLRSNV